MDVNEVLFFVVLIVDYSRALDRSDRKGKRFHRSRFAAKLFEKLREECI